MTGLPPLMIAVSGASASGKTTLAVARAASAYAIPENAFDSVVRKLNSQDVLS